MHNAPRFRRPKTIQNRLNAGTKIEGLLGYVSATTKCCSGRSTAYIPVKVVGVQVGHCKFTLTVSSRSEDTIIARDQFTVDPDMFFESVDQIRAYEAHLEQVRLFNQAMMPFQYDRGTKVRRRNLLKEALKTIPSDKYQKVAEELDQEIHESGGLGELDNSWINAAYHRLMMAKFFPYYKAEEDDEAEEQENDWDDEE